MSSGPEKIVELQIESACLDAGCIVKRLKLTTERGWPDLTIFGNGKRVEVEVKEPGGGVLSYNQIKIHRELREVGQIVLVATSVDIVHEILKHLGML